MMTAEERNEFETSLEANKKLIRIMLAERNIHRPELDAMLAAYEKSIRERYDDKSITTVKAQ